MAVSDNTCRLGGSQLDNPQLMFHGGNMELPKVSNVLIDATKNIRYEVLAYRTLSRDERTLAVRVFLSGIKKKPKRNSNVTIVSTID